MTYRGWDQPSRFCKWRKIMAISLRKIGPCIGMHNPYHRANKIDLLLMNMAISRRLPMRGGMDSTNWNTRGFALRSTRATINLDILWTTICAFSFFFECILCEVMWTALYSPGMAWIQLVAYFKTRLTAHGKGTAKAHGMALAIKSIKLHPDRTPESLSEVGGCYNLNTPCSTWCNTKHRKRRTNGRIGRS